MRKVSLSMLIPDMCLARPIYHKKSLLLREGTSGLNRFIHSFEALGIYQIYIEDSAGEGIIIPDAITDETRIKCRIVLENSFTKLRADSTIDITDLAGTIDTLLDEIMNRQDILISLNDIGTTDDSTLVHSVNTTVYAILLGNQLGYSKKELRYLAEGTLLHDVGKKVMDQEILLKPDRLTENEFEYIKHHTTLGYEILRKNPLLTELSRIVALSHHERMDGSGYPNGLMGDKIHELVRVAAIADVYEALTAERCYRKSMSPSKAIEILLMEAADKLDARLVALFVQNIAVYPNGSMVLLSDGRYAVVKEQSESMPLRPVVRIINIEKGKHIPDSEVDLMKELNLTIIEDVTYS